MHVIDAVNVNDAYVKGMRLLEKHGVLQPSRAGDVRVIPAPVTTRYQNPCERVLFDEARDANPFFHLMEALWMLAGRNDATWLDQFVGDFSKRFSEDGIQHGAYGFRWRTHFTLSEAVEPGSVWMGQPPDAEDFEPIDQLQVVIDKLKADPFDRRVVIQMWDPTVDLCADKRDIPCNLCVMPRVISDTGGNWLDITVACRSNDIIWGAYGANVVHFSVLQEYLAAKIGVKVGRYWQLSNNFHAYNDVFYKKLRGLPNTFKGDFDEGDRYARGMVKATPIVTDVEKFDRDLALFFDPEYKAGYFNEFFATTAVPMRLSYEAWRRKDHLTAMGTLEEASPIAGRPKLDWLLAARLWYARRLAKIIPDKVEESAVNG